MQIVIPMSGFGERFRRAGYQLPKPLIEVQGKPMISHVVDMFPNEKNVIFICNKNHLEAADYEMFETLQRAHPLARVVGIPEHKKGPIHAIRQIEDYLDHSQPVLVNYSDFTCYWDWEAFKTFTEETACAGAIPAYKGFHPHSLGSTNYAYIRERGGIVQDIQEKKPFTQNRMEEFASSGTYYFSSAELMLGAFEETVARDRSVGGEYYVSLAYKSLLEAGQSTLVYPLQHFVQWGTPEDVDEYRLWSSAFESLAMTGRPSRRAQGTVIIPMAGIGKRYLDQGYSLPKPFIEVSGEPMFLQSARDLTPAERYVFVVRREMDCGENLAEQIKTEFSDATVCYVEALTEGQAITALRGVEALDFADEKCGNSLTIAPSDSGALYDSAELERLILDPSIDVIVWGFRGYPNAERNPQMYGWVEEQNGRVISISVKEPIGDPKITPIVVGTFIFKRSSDFEASLQSLIDREGRVNSEYYIDSLINDAVQLGLSCKLFEITHYLNWGTPNDLRTYEYWQSFFSKWDAHPYSLEHDSRVPSQKVPMLKERYSSERFNEESLS